jgi:hypothetical protein
MAAWLWKALPWFAFNELVLGQRLLRGSLYCRGCQWGYVRCQACRRFHDVDRVWTRPAGNWRAFSCPDCGDALPTHENYVTTGVLGLGKVAARGLSRLAKRRPRP